MGGVQGVLVGGGTVVWGCGGMPFQDGNRLASGGSANCVWCVSEVSVPSVNERRERGRQGSGNALPPRGFWAGLGYSSGSGSWLHDVNHITLVSVPRAVFLPSQLCSYCPTEPSLREAQPSPDVWACAQVHTDMSVCREPARTCFCTAWYILSAALFILRAHYCFLTDVAHLR